MGEDHLDQIARAVAGPMPRRRALRLLGAGVVVTLAPGVGARRARAAAPTPPCSVSGGRFCGNVVAGGYNIGCCLGAKNETRTVCCPGQPGVVGSLCCPTGYTCGNTSANSTENCKCASKVTCNGTCCRPGEYCETRLIGADSCDKLCPVTHEHKCNGVCCTSNETCGFFGCKCKGGLVPAGTGTCLEPREDPGDPQPGNNPIRNMLNMMGASSSAHGGSRRSLLAFSAQSGSAAVDEALSVIAAVNGQGAAAMLAIGQGKRDSAFRSKVTVARATPSTLTPGAGLDAGSVAALNKLLSAEAHANALIAAMSKALWRARGAHAKHNRKAAKSQLLASAGFATQAVTALKSVQGLRTAAANAMTAGAVVEVWAFDGGIDAFIATVQSSGLPASLRASMSRLGLTSTDLKRLRAGVLDRAPSTAVGPVLIAPLKSADRATELTGLISELSKYASRARKHPIAH